MPELDPAGNVKPYPREEWESEMFSTLDREHKLERWTTSMVFDPDGKPKDKNNPWKSLNEIGAAHAERHRELAADPKVIGNQFKKGENGDPGNAWVNDSYSYALKVEFFGGKAALEPVVRPLPPFYLPQALTTMLPRLVPPNEPKGYLMATYVSEVRQVVLRYIDVERAMATPPIIAATSGKLMAVPIRDRNGFEGSPTIHWIAVSHSSEPGGGIKSEYLGSTTESTKMTILPTEEAVIRRIWNINEGRVFEKYRDPNPTTVPATPRPGTGRPGALPQNLRNAQP